jgi:hypothetical protein
MYNDRVDISVINSISKVSLFKPHDGDIRIIRTADVSQSVFEEFDTIHGGEVSLQFPYFFPIHCIA